MNQNRGAAESSARRLEVRVVDRWFYDGRGRRSAARVDAGRGVLWVSGLAEPSVAEAAVAAGYRRWSRSSAASTRPRTRVAKALKKAKGVMRRRGA